MIAMTFSKREERMRLRICGSLALYCRNLRFVGRGGELFYNHRDNCSSGFLSILNITFKRVCLSSILIYQQIFELLLKEEN
jgi:hypothetical protein